MVRICNGVSVLGVFLLICVWRQEKCRIKEICRKSICYVSYICVSFRRIHTSYVRGFLWTSLFLGFGCFYDHDCSYNCNLVN
jgi:hypothetical protein